MLPVISDRLYTGRSLKVSRAVVIIFGIFEDVLSCKNTGISLILLFIFYKNIKNTFQVKKQMYDFLKQVSKFIHSLLFIEIKIST